MVTDHQSLSQTQVEMLASALIVSQSKIYLHLHNGYILTQEVIVEIKQTHE